MTGSSGSAQVVVALDVDTMAAAEALTDQLGDLCTVYKVGWELLTAVGPDAVRYLLARGKKVFLDLKLFEIPHSVAGAVRAAGSLGVSMVSVHGFGGPGILAAATEAARDFPRLKILALTVVTSMTTSDLAAIGITSSVEDQVRRLAELARQAGCHGVICSPQEVSIARRALGNDALVVTSGARRTGGAPADHARTAIPEAAAAAGASHIVVGRAITRAPDPAAAFRRLRAALEPKTADRERRSFR